MPISFMHKITPQARYDKPLKVCWD